ncbi:MAG: tetratricopeptide repeat protein [Leptospiraceae bacterium]|nr:tetratricopeptide repeat protein [Leptospiraceae bacterium]MCP5493531.1 tetratricopeptide repeat protein [Leptospiraceae bacterium]
MSKKESYLKAINKKNFPLALTLLDQELNEDPENPELLYNFAICCSQTSNHKKAISVLEEILAKFPKFIERDNIYRLIIYSKILMGENQDALALIEERLKISIDDIKLLSFRAFIFEKMNQIEDAIAVHRKILTIQPDYKNSLNSLGYLLINEREPSKEDVYEAMHCLKKAMQEDSNNPAYLDSFGMLLLAQGSIENAQKAFSKALSLMPGEPTILQHASRIIREKA